MLWQRVLIINIILSLILETKMAALEVKHREVTETHQLSSQAPLSQVHLSQVHLSHTPVSQVPHSQASESFTIHTHEDLTVRTPSTPSMLPKEPLLASRASPALLEETGAGELVMVRGAAKESGGLGPWSVQPRLRLGSDGKAENGVLFNQRELGSNLPMEQPDTGMSGSEEGSEVEGSSLPDPGQWWAFSTAESPPNPLHPATQNSPRHSSQGPDSGRSFVPIYTFPASSEHWLSMRTPTGIPETLRDTEPPPHTTPDTTVNSHIVLSSVSQPPPGISSPTPVSGAATEPATVLPATVLPATVLPATVLPATDHTRAEPSDVTHSAAAISPGDIVTGDDRIGTGTSSSEEFTPNYQLSATPTQSTETRPTPTKQPHASNQTHQTPLSTTPGEKWPTGEERVVVPSFPGCDLRGNSSDGAGSVPPYPEGTQTGLLQLPLPPLFVSLGVEWSTALAEWGAAWDLLVYGLGSVFGLVSLASALCLLCLPFRSPATPGLSFLLLAEGLLLLSGLARAFTFLYDAYGHWEKLSALVALLLYELVSPCLASALGVVFLLLWLGPGPQFSVDWCPRACILASIAGLHCALSLSAVLGCALLALPPFLLLSSQAMFVLWVSVLSVLYLAFYCRSRQAYQRPAASSSTSGILNPEAGRWALAVQAGAWASGFGLCLAGVRLYCVLQWLGLAGPQTFPAWPWWALQLGGSLCEGALCLSLALVGLYLSLGFVGRTPGRGCWATVFSLSPAHASMKAPILSGQYNWASGYQEKQLGLQLYSLADPQRRNGERLNLIYHSSETTQAKTTQNEGTSPAPSSSSSSVIRATGDSSVDLRPPSPIDLRRSIDEALLPGSLFRRPLLLSSGGTSPCGAEPAIGDRQEDVSGETPGLHHVGRTDGGAFDHFSSSGSCLLLSACLPSPELSWYRDGRSANITPHPVNAGDSAEFMQICRQIDQLSVQSETIEL